MFVVNGSCNTALYYMYKPLVLPAIVVIALVLAVIALFLFITWLYLKSKENEVT